MSANQSSNVALFDVMNIPLYKEDMIQIGKWAGIGALAFALYQGSVMIERRNTNPCVDLVVPAESLGLDPELAREFVKLQNFRKLNPCSFDTAVRNADRLVFLEHALYNEEDTTPRTMDKKLAFTYFQVSVRHLKILQQLAKERLGVDYGVAAHLVVRRIFEKLQVHLINILKVCKDFNPNALMRQADQLIESMKTTHEPDKARRMWKQYAPSSRVA